MDIAAPWQVTTTTTEVAANLAFSTASEVKAEQFVRWQLNLPANSQQVDGYFAAQTANLQASAVALKQIPQRFTQVEQALSLSKQVVDSPSFAIETADIALNLPPLEATLFQQLQSPPEEGVSFGLGTDVSTSFKAFMTRAQQIVAHQAWVETRIENHLVGQTVVGWTGDFRTAWQNGADSQEIRHHQRSLKLALATRQTILRVTTLVIKLSLSIAALQGGNLLAAPAVWNYVEQVMTEIKAYQTQVN